MKKPSLVAVLAVILAAAAGAITAVLLWGSRVMRRLDQEMEKAREANRPPAPGAEPDKTDIDK